VVAAVEMVAIVLLVVADTIADLCNWVGFAEMVKMDEETVYAVDLVSVALFIPLYNVARHTFNLVGICSTTQPINVSNYTGIMQSRGLFRFFETPTA
jgi:hypothetical protein